MNDLQQRYEAAIELIAELAYAGDAHAAWGGAFRWEMLDEKVRQRWRDYARRAVERRLATPPATETEQQADAQARREG